MAEIAWLAAVFGVGAALSAGPVSVTIVRTAVSRGFGAAFRVIVGSAVADLLMLVPALAFGWVLSLVARASVVVNLIGAVSFAYLAVRAARDAWRLWGSGGLAPGRDWAFTAGLLSNLANPLTWMFWLTIGTPMMSRADRLGGAAGITLWVVAWFLAASGLEAMAALAVSSARRSIGGRGQAVMTAASAAFFAALAVWMVA